MNLRSPVGAPLDLVNVVSTLVTVVPSTEVLISRSVLDIEFKLTSWKYPVTSIKFVPDALFGATNEPGGTSYGSRLTKKELAELQDNIKSINSVQIKIGELELGKLNLAAQFNQLNNNMREFQAKLEKKYGSVNINVNTGEFKDETNKKK